MRYVEIYEKATGKVEKRMGPHDPATAISVKAGASINLNHDDYAVRIVDEEETKQ